MTAADTDLDADLRLVSEARDRLLAERGTLLARLAKIDAALGKMPVVPRQRRPLADVLEIVRRLEPCTSSRILAAWREVEPRASSHALHQKLGAHVRRGDVMRTVGADGLWVYEVAK